MLLKREILQAKFAIVIKVSVMIVAKFKFVVI